MMTALSLFFVAAGLVLTSAYPLLGVLVIVFVAWPIFKRASVRDEESFLTFLAVGAGLGVLFTFGEWLLQRL